MAAVDVTARDNPPVNDDLDDLFNYEVDDALFKDVDTNMDVVAGQKSAPNGNNDVLGGGLGLDQEIKVKKQREPVPKLDVDRLTSKAGIPKLRKIARDKFKFRGKGREFSDIARILSLYQLWLDDLYPRAKFADALAIVEKVGHEKRMQVMRKEWINENKTTDDSDHRHAHGVQKIPDHRASDAPLRSDGDKAPDSRSMDGNLAGTGDGPRGEGLHMTTEGESRLSRPAADESLFWSDEEVPSNNAPDDDLDAILAEDEAQKGSVPVQKSSLDQKQDLRDDFADDEEAMAFMDDM